MHWTMWPKRAGHRIQHSWLCSHLGSITVFLLLHYIMPRRSKCFYWGGGGGCPSNPRPRRRFAAAQRRTWEALTSVKLSGKMNSFQLTAVSQSAVVTSRGSKREARPSMTPDRPAGSPSLRARNELLSFCHRPRGDEPRRRHPSGRARADALGGGGGAAVTTQSSRGDITWLFLCFSIGDVVILIKAVYSSSWSRVERI